MSTFRVIRLCSLLMAFLFTGLSSGWAADSSKDKQQGSPDRLVQILLRKGILTADEVDSLGKGSSAEQQAGSSVSFVTREFSLSPRPRPWELRRQRPKSPRH